MSIEPSVGAHSKRSDAHRVGDDGEPSTPSLDEMKRTRQSARTNVTLCLKDLQAVYDLQYRAQADELSLRMHLVERGLSDLTKIEDMMERSGASDGMHARYERDVFALMYKSQLLFSRLEAREKELATQHASLAPTLPAGSMDTVGLPALELPKFDGNPENWRTFWELFDSAIHSRRSLSDVQKFTYLKMCLVGKAVNALIDVPVSGANYPTALQVLTRRFADPSLLIGTFSARLASLPSVARNDTKALRSFIDSVSCSWREIRSVVAGLRVQGNSDVAPSQQPFDMSSVALCPWILSRLPEDLQLAWRRVTVNPLDRYDVDKLIEFCRVELENREALNLPGPSSSPRSYEKPPRYSSQGGAVGGYMKTATSSLVALEPSGSQVVSCPCCLSATHPVSRCDAFRAKSSRDRYDLVKNMRLCINCLRSSHMAKDCDSRYNCSHCSARHHSLLCFRGEGEASSSLSPRQSSHGRQASTQRNHPPRRSNTTTSQDRSSHTVATPPTSSPVVGITGFTMSSTSAVEEDPIPSDHPASVFLQVARVFVRVEGAGQGCWVYAFIDQGSRRSYIKTDLAKFLGLPVCDRQTFTTGSFGEQLCTLTSDQVSFVAQGISGPPVELRAWTTERLCPPFRQEKVDSLPLPLSSLTPWADEFDGGLRRVSLLIGADQLWTVCTGELVRVPGFPVAVGSIFGWMLSGRVSGGSTSSSSPDSCSLSFFIQESQERDIDIDFLWRLETIGVENPVDCPDFATPTFVDDRYQLPLPFKDNRRPQCNFSSAKAQLQRLEQCLSPEQREVYSQNIDSMLSKGIVERATSPPDVGYFMPHHGVWKKKLRVVFNASASSPSRVSLNSCLDPGPNLLALVSDVVMRFRLRPVPVLADVEAAFHQVAVPLEDRVWLKFLWNNESFQFRRVPFGISCGPYMLNAVVRHHVSRFQEFGESFPTQLLESMYCDDVVRSCEDEASAQVFLAQAQDCFAAAGMILKPTEDPQKVLGVPWDPALDCLSVNFSVVRTPTKYSRRELLSSLSRIYDPEGFASAWTIRARLLLQSAWQAGTKWDDDLPQPLREEWFRWSLEAVTVTLSIPRWIRYDDTCSLHVFCDASQKAYAIIAYLVHPVHGSSFLFAKSRVAPLKPALSVPRLELLAALTGARFARHFLSSIAVVPVFLWTDSQTVLSWIRNGLPKRDIFVSNRLREILSKTDSSWWNFVPSALNAADIPSRGAPLFDIACNELYLVGPEFIRKPKSEWPQVMPSSLTLVVPDPMVEEKNLLEHVVPPENFSSLTRFVNVSAWILRAVENFKRLVSRRTLVLGPLALSERNAALRHAVVVEQAVAYSDELRSLRHPRTEQAPRVASTSPLLPLHPRISEDDLLVAVPRTGSQPVPILPQKSHLSRLVMEHYHCHLMHQGAEATLAEIRRHFWIPKARSAVKAVVSRCLPCRRWKAPPFRTSESALQPFRVKPNAPFACTGVDYMGPLYLADGRKSWILLFTCSSTRAVHLELVLDSGAQAAHVAFRRFLARRLRPFSTVDVFTDNAKSFLRLSSMKFPLHTLRWRTIPERSPNWGGWWERLVRSVKTPLRITFRNLKLSEKELEAVVFEIEAVVNCRPLTVVSTDVNDPLPLTPADLLLGSGLEPLDANAIPNDHLRRLALLRQQSTDRFWRRWSREYLTRLYTWNQHSASSPLPRAGQTVLVRTDLSPRGSWPLAIIEELIVGGDGIARAAWIRMRGIRTRRAIDRLIPLEADVSPINESPGTCRGGLLGVEKPPLDCLTSQSSEPAPSKLAVATVSHHDVDPVPRTTRRGRVTRRPTLYPD